MSVVVVVCRAGVWDVASQLCVPCGLSVGGRLTLQRYCAARGVVNVFCSCCTNLRGFCANNRFCGGQSRLPVQGRAYASYQSPPKSKARIAAKSAGTDDCRRGGFRPYPLSSLLHFAAIRQKLLGSNRTNWHPFVRIISIFN